MPYLRTTLSRAIAAALLISLAACGGGGGGGESTGPVTPTDPNTPTNPGNPNNPGNPSTDFASYQRGTLPGRLLMNSPLGRQAVVLDLKNGRRVELPHTDGSLVDGDRWSASADGDTLLRWNVDGTAIPVRAFDGGSMQALSSERNLADGLDAHDLRMSPDGRYVLAQYADGFDKRLTVFDAQTFAVVKRGSLLDGNSVIGEPQAWLPDGRYIYLVANRLYASRPDAVDSQLLAIYDLPTNGSLDPDSYVVGQSDIAVSPDGSRIAFTWRSPRTRGSATIDVHIYTARVDGLELRKVTEVADAGNVLDHAFGSPTWSPDGRWLAFGLFMSASTSAPVWPDDPFGGWKVIGTTGCDVSPVYVVPADASGQKIGAGTLRTDLGVRVRAGTGQSFQWVSSCSRFKWVP